jgi:hypothetical protein
MQLWRNNSCSAPYKEKQASDYRQEYPGADPQSPFRLSPEGAVKGPPNTPQVWQNWKGEQQKICP